MKKFILFILFLSALPVVYAQTTLPSFFSSQMVLQQSGEVPLWGRDAPGTKVSLSASWGAKARTKTDKEGNWKVKIATPKAGGPYTLTISGSETVVLDDVLIGEVWLCSGQSNMYMPVKGYTNQPVKGSNDAILHSKNNEIRLFHAKRTASVAPLENVEGEWRSASPATVPEFSATAYFFAKLVQEVLDVPVGIIHTSWGGSSVEAWIDKETLSSLQNIQVTIPTEVPKSRKNKTATLLYNGMLHPFVEFRIRGVLWYQGEANRSNAAEYKTLFPSMIRSWREKWQQGKFPFYFAQIAPYSYKNVNAAFLREAQLYTQQEVENTGMAVTLDIGDCDNIHPARKKTVGDRLAYWALANTYGIEGIAYSGPVYESMEITGDGGIKISFTHAENGLSSFQKELSGFEIAGEDRVFHPAEAKINRDKTITVSSKEVSDPVAVRYAFDNCVEGSLYNSAGLPASSFRTDQWEAEINP